MQSCVIYARVSTKEQEAEGYSIPAQLKALRAFCERERLAIAAEFTETESAGKTGRTSFTAMCAFLQEHPDVRTVVAHKLDRLYRNFADPLTLEEEIGARTQFVVGDFPDSPQGALARDVNLAVAKHYLANLRAEVRKGMEEKVAQGGWPHKAPVGYLNDKNTRSLVVDPERAAHVVWAFERYSTGLVSLSTLASELAERGFSIGKNGALHISALDKMLKNPIYCGDLRYKGQTYPGAHEPLIARELFERVQQSFAPNRRKNNAQKRVYALRDFLYCAECGSKITAGTHKGLVYYRCTHGKGPCSQRSYTREEVLEAQVAEVLGSIAITPDIIEALVEEARIREQRDNSHVTAERSRIERSLASIRTKEAALLNHLLDGTIDKATYTAKAEELASDRLTLERGLEALDADLTGLSEQVEALLRTGADAHMHFEEGDVELKRRTLAEVLCNLTVQEGRIASYQYKDPFGVLEMSPEGALLHPWWALEDLNL